MSVAAAWWPPSPIPMATSSGCFKTDECRSLAPGPSVVATPIIGSPGSRQSSFRRRRRGGGPLASGSSPSDLAERKPADEGHAEVRQEHHGDRTDAREIHGRGTRRDEGARPRAEGGRAPRSARGQGGRGKRRAREDRRDAEAGSGHRQAAPCDHQSQRAGPLAEDLVRDAPDAKDGKAVCFFQSAQTLKTRDAAFGSSDGTSHANA